MGRKRGEKVNSQQELPPRWILRPRRKLNTQIDTRAIESLSLAEDSSLAYTHKKPLAKPQPERSKKEGDAQEIQIYPLFCNNSVFRTDALVVTDESTLLNSEILKRANVDFGLLAGQSLQVASDKEILNDDLIQTCIADADVADNCSNGLSHQVCQVALQNTGLYDKASKSAQALITPARAALDLQSPVLLEAFPLLKSPEISDEVIIDFFNKLSPYQTILEDKLGISVSDDTAHRVEQGFKARKRGPWENFSQSINEDKNNENYHSECPNKTRKRGLNELSPSRLIVKTNVPLPEKTPQDVVSIEDPIAELIELEERLRQEKMQQAFANAYKEKISSLDKPTKNTPNKELIRAAEFEYLLNSCSQYLLTGNRSPPPIKAFNIQDISPTPLRKAAQMPQRELLQESEYGEDLISSLLKRMYNLESDVSILENIVKENSLTIGKLVVLKDKKKKPKYTPEGYIIDGPVRSIKYLKDNFTQTEDTTTPISPSKKIIENSMLKIKQNRKNKRKNKKKVVVWF